MHHITYQINLFLYRNTNEAFDSLYLNSQSNLIILPFTLFELITQID